MAANESKEPVLTVQKGIWIDERWLQDAGIGTRIQVIVQPGEIRIVSLQDTAELTQEVQTSSAEAETAWTPAAEAAFRGLWEEATSGTLDNPSLNHDRYLYGGDG